MMIKKKSKRYDIMVSGCFLQLFLIFVNSLECHTIWLTIVSPRWNNAKRCEKYDGIKI